jgi:hypothetical protein
MGFIFNDNKIFVPFKTIEWPNLLVLSLVANIPYNIFDILESSIVNIGSQIILVD